MSSVNRTVRYELTLYKPLSEDPTESQVLTQLEDAGEQFVVTTDPSDARPYLEIPAGRGGEVRVPERKVEIGTSSVRVLDAQMTGQLDRWFTRFVGDASGRNRLKGLKARLREWDSGAAQWVTVYTRRVRGVRMADTKLWVELELKDLVEDLDSEVFAGPAHGSLDYVKRGSLLPVGLVEPWAGLDAYTVAPLTGTFHPNSIDIDVSAVDEGRDVIVRELWDRLWGDGERGGFPLVFIPEYIRTVRVRVKILQSTAQPGRVGEEGHFWLAKTLPVVTGWVSTQTTAIRFRIDDKQRFRALRVGILEVDSADPDYLAAPSDGDVVEFNLFGYGPPTERDPLLIGPVHPARLVEDLLAGKFGPLSPPGAPLLTFGADSDAFTALKADPSFGDVHLLAYGPRNLRELLEQTLNLPHGLGYRVDELGRYVPQDWRLTSAALAGLVTIGDTDVVPGARDALDWEDAEDGAVTKIEVAYYTDVALVPWQLHQMPEGVPDVPAVRFATSRHRRIVVLGRYGQLGEDGLEIDAEGIRDIVAGPREESSDRVKALVGRIPDAFRSAFGNGPRYITLRCRRTANVESCVEGALRKLTYSPVIDPATNRRGGPRLVRCIQRTPDGLHMRLRFLDLGSDVVANPPALGAVVKHGADGRHSVDVPVTLNAQGEPAVLEYAVTATSVGVRPAEDDPLWAKAERLEASGTAIIGPFPAGKRVWLRARSEVDEGRDPKIPSAWAFPAASYVDLDALPAPTNVQLSAVGRTLVATCTVGDATLPLMPVIAPAPGPAVDALRTALPEGTERHVFTGLLAATTYVAGFKHVDGHGGESAAATASLATGAAQQLAAPRRLQIRQGRTTLSKQLTVPDEASIGYGLWISFHPAEPLARHHLQISADPAFGTVETELVVDAGVALAPMLVQRDAADAVRYVRIRAERAGDHTPSPWSDIVGGQPTELLASPGPDLFPGGFAELRARPDGELEIRIGDGGDDDTERAHFEVVKNPVDPAAYPAVDETDELVERADMPYDGPVDDGGGGNLTGTVGDLFLGRVRFWSSVAGFGQEVLLKLVVSADALVDCQPVLDEDVDGKFNLHPYRSAVARSVKWLKKTDGSTPTIEEVRAGAISTLDDFLVHTSTKDGEPIVAGVIAYENADATGAEGPLRIARDVYHAGDQRPVVTWKGYQPTDGSKEGVRFIARDDGATVNFGYAVQDADGADPAWPGGFVTTGLVADPVTVEVEVAKPAEGGTEKEIIFQAIDAAGNLAYEKPRRIRVDGDEIPRGTCTGTADGAGNTFIDASSIDSDTGSLRLKVSKTAPTDPSGASDGSEFTAAAFPVRIALGAAWKLAPSQKLHVRGFFARTGSEVWATQNASTKSPPFGFTIEAPGAAGGDVGNFVRISNPRWFFVSTTTMGVKLDVYAGPDTDQVYFDYLDPGGGGLTTGQAQAVSPGANELTVKDAGGAPVAWSLTSSDPPSILAYPVDTTPDPDETGEPDAIHFDGVGDTPELAMRGLAQDGTTTHVYKTLAAIEGEGLEFAATGAKVKAADLVKVQDADPSGAWGAADAGKIWVDPV